MPCIDGVGDEILLAALAVTVAPLVVALSPQRLRREPLAVFHSGTAALSRALARFLMWPFRRSQGGGAPADAPCHSDNNLEATSAVSDRQRTREGEGSAEGLLSRSDSAAPSAPPIDEHAFSGDTRDRDRERTSTLTRRSNSGRAQKAELLTDASASSSGSRHMKPAAAADRTSWLSPEDQERDSVGPSTGAAELASSSAQGGSSAAQADGARETRESDGVLSPPDGEICSVCHDDFTLPCQANCGHWFCAECILRVWHHGSALSPCRCPICRRTITLLLLAEEPTHTPSSSAPASPSPSPSPTLPSSAPAPIPASLTTPPVPGPSPGRPGVLIWEPPPSAGISSSTRFELLRDVAKYNRLFGGVPVPIWQRVLDMPLLLRRMGRDLLDPNRTLHLLHNVRFAVCIACVGIYVLSPLDFISESLLGLLGLVDDIVFLVCVAFYLTVLYRALLVTRASAFPSEAWPTEGWPPHQPQQQTLDDSSLH